MGGCLTRLKAEMVAPPANSGNWDQFSPQKFTPQPRRQGEGYRAGIPLTRRETPSGIEGLTYDHAGRPVWRDPKSNTSANMGDMPEVEHIEARR